MIVAVIALFDHFKFEPASHALAVKVTLVPVQMFVPLLVTVGAAGLVPAFISKPLEKSLSHLPTIVHLALYVPAAVAGRV